MNPEETDIMPGQQSIIESNNPLSYRQKPCRLSLSFCFFKECIRTTEDASSMADCEASLDITVSPEDNG